MVQTKIARILSPTQVVLAGGTEQGIREGMEFVIYELSEPIFDPDTRESLGQLELHKGRLKVLFAQDKIATATTLKRKVYRQSIADFAALSGLTGGWTEDHEKLPVETSAITALKNELTVKVGDLVRSVL